MALAVILAISFATLATCTPFGTVNNHLLHQHNEHQMITRLALGCPPGTKSDGICFETASLWNLAGDKGFNGAVGSPDSLSLLPEKAEAHCDDADFLNISNYPQSREQATAKLQACVEHLRMRFIQGVNAAGRMVDSNNNLIPNEVAVFAYTNHCEFNHRDTTDNLNSKAKCAALEGLGRALHGTQDFYSHSNWADQSDANRPISLSNPPGLNRRDVAPFLDLRAHGAITLVPDALTTGCFSPAEMILDGQDGSFACKNRVIHAQLNKDHGFISLDGTITPDPEGVPRSAIPDNFLHAVRAAVADSQARWKNFRDELHTQHGSEKANLLICALVRDYPDKHCRNRKIAIVIDSSGSNKDTDPANLRISAAKQFNSRLTTKAQVVEGVMPDRVTVIDFDSSARVLYPMGDPAGAAQAFDSIDSEGGTNIGRGIALGIDEIMKEEAGEYARRAGIVVLTDGEDNSPANQVAQLERARSQGIRVNYGFLSPPAIPAMRKRSLNKRGPNPDIIAAILSTGGTYGIIESAAAQKSFIDLVVARGVTDIDAAVGSTVLKPGITVSESISPNMTSHDFTYSASPGEIMNFTTTIVKGSGVLHGVLRDVRNNSDIVTLHRIINKPTSFVLQAVEKMQLEFVISATANVTSEVFFSVGMTSNLSAKNGTGACLARRGTPGVVMLDKRQSGNKTTIATLSSSTPATNIVQQPYQTLTLSCH